MGVPFTAAHGSIRFSLSRYNSQADVDGVMTNGHVLLLPDGGEVKAFHVRDGLGVSLAHRAGLRTGLLSGRSSEIVSRRASELGMTIVRQGVRDKAAELRDILDKEGLETREVAYIGDDGPELRWYVTNLADAEPVLGSNTSARR